MEVSRALFNTCLLQTRDFRGSTVSNGHLEQFQEQHHHIVRHDDLGLLRIRVIKSAQLPQIVCLVSVDSEQQSVCRSLLGPLQPSQPALKRGRGREREREMEK